MITMRASLLSTLALALSLGLSPAVRAGEVTDVSLGTWAPGSVVTLTGSGFDGGGKPKVFGVREGEKKKIATKVTDYSDTSITLEVKAVPNSKKDPADGKTWDILVQPKGKQAGEDCTSVGAVTTEAPTVLEVSAASGDPGSEVEIRVANLGTKGKPKIKIGGKKAKVKSVTVEEQTFLGEVGPISTILALIPKSLGNGIYDLILQNKVGETTEDDAVTVSGSSMKLGSPNITFTVNGKKYVIKGKLLSDWNFAGVAGVITGSVGKQPTRAVQLTGIQFNPNTDQPPMTFHGLPGDIAAMVYSETTLNGLVPTIVSWTGTGFDITVTALSGGQIGMDFSGTLSSAGKPNVEIEGTVVADIVFP